MRRYRLPLLAVLILIVAAGWTVAWNRIATGIHDRVGPWAEARRAEGLKVDYGAVTVSGFPFRWRLSIEQPHLAGAGATEWDWQGAAVQADLSPWSQREVRLHFPGDQRFAVGAGDIAEVWTLRAERPDGSVGIDDQGRIERIGLDLGTAQFTRSTDTQPTRVDRLTADARIHHGAGDHQTDTFDLALTLDNMALAETPVAALGTKIAQAALDLSFKGKLQPGKLADSVGAWRDSGGTIEINRIVVKWGPVDADGNGTLALDDQNRPLGAFAARWRGYGDALDALVAVGKIKPFQAAAAKIVLNAIAHNDANDGTREARIPLTAQDGRLFVAGVPLMPVPSLKFE